ncbi:histone-lysine N-methyltransferase, H3 lysine-9 specific SUVH4-like isoform X3 [Phragmites australis]|uniref:histone-lysine N-methyltransferase, H3 lysine-9 specific SUVH4-like isoform X3 n=1 Tax=Phragmites australis TaxID=29695 RepID=UPI002D79CB0C|nr:histone-lysine N-methyltransferase, H3 lysine-9 specific SUVH4-like isoform X3 [Phragmites australis]
METMDSVAVIEVLPVPHPPFIDATPLQQPPPLEALALRRSARCLNRPSRPSYAEQVPPKQPSGRGRGGSKRKKDEEKQEPAAGQNAKKPGRKTAKVEPEERKPMQMIAAVPISYASVAGAAAEDDVTGSGKSAKLRVKEILRAFNSHYLHFVQEEQKRAHVVLQEIEAKEGLKRQTKGGKNKKGDRQDAEGEEKEKRPSKRPDLKAITKMQETNAVLYPEKRIGHLPGIDVGDQFYSRAEMVVLGIHSHWLNGIDYMGVKYEGKEEYKNLTFPLATCIVMSGIYEDDLDKADEIIYTGQGGNDLLGNHRQIGSQQLKRGNLALKVVDDWVQNGVQGHVVFKYKLKRLEGQPSLTTSEVRFTRAEAPITISELPGLVCDDISGGQENIPIPATNLVDDPPVPPSGFTYSKSLEIPKGIKIPSNITGCDCEGDCASNKNCSCAQRNGSDLPYVSYKNIGRLVEPKAVVFECGANCSCNHDCVNKTSQQGLQYRLEVFKTASKGWGVRTWDTILPGAPICEYTGVLRRTEDLDGLQNNYVFDIDCLQTMKGLDGREKRAGSEMHLPNLHPENDSEAPPAPEYCIDASFIGNFARFINHSCQPNLFVQCVLSSHNDVKLAKVTLFAADTILPLQELSYDYGYRLDSVVGPDGNIVKLPCYCGAPDCRKRLY